MLEAFLATDILAVAQLLICLFCKVVMPIEIFEFLEKETIAALNEFFGGSLLNEIPMVVTLRVVLLLILMVMGFDRRALTLDRDESFQCMGNLSRLMGM